MIVTVEIAEVHKAIVRVEVPDNATADDCRSLASQKMEEEGTDNTEYSHTLDPDTWIVRKENGDFVE